MTHQAWCWNETRAQGRGHVNFERLSVNGCGVELGPVLRLSIHSAVMESQHDTGGREWGSGPPAPQGPLGLDPSKPQLPHQGMKIMGAAWGKEPLWAKCQARAGPGVGVPVNVCLVSSCLPETKGSTYDGCRWSWISVGCNLLPGPWPPSSSSQPPVACSHSGKPLLSQPVLTGVESSVFCPLTRRRPPSTGLSWGCPAVRASLPQFIGPGLTPQSTP